MESRAKCDSNLSGNGRQINSPSGFESKSRIRLSEAQREGNLERRESRQGALCFWYVKNLFDAVDYGIVELEQAFMPHLLSANNRTMYEELTPTLELLDAGSLPALLTEGKTGRN